MKRQDFKNLVTEMENNMVRFRGNTWNHAGLCRITSLAVNPKGRLTKNVLMNNIGDSIREYFNDNERPYFLGPTSGDTNFFNRLSVIYLWEQIILDNGEYKKW